MLIKIIIIEMICAPDNPNKYLGLVLMNSIENLSVPAKNKYNENKNPFWILYFKFHNIEKIIKPIIVS